MSTSSAVANKCPKCGADLPSAATAGICPRCLMAEAMVATQGDAEPSAMGKTLSPAELAPHFPQLEILECLGRGGMGVVYKARQKSLNRFVALKLLAPERVTNGKFAERFTHEAQALAALNHPSIVTIYDFGQAGGFYFLLMEFVDGVNLRQAMKAGRFTPEQALAVVPPVCEALQYAHEHGIVHRDIKPENLLLDREGRVKIADFGIAKMLGGDATTILPPDQPQTESAENEGTLASAAGTPQYMAPEQKEHRRTDHRADIYSLGVVLYELLTGELPADKLQPPSSRLRGMQIDVRLDEIVLRALEKMPELRYQTAGEFRTQVENLTNGSSDSHVAASDKLTIPPRFSRSAIVAASWITLSVFVLPPFFWHELKTHEFEHGGPFGNLLGAVISFLFLLPAFTAPMGATILGWIAASQIRRSPVKLHGLGLAVFDGLFFPLLALDALIISADLRGRTHIVGPGLTPGVTMAEQNIPASVVVLMMAIIIVVNFLIIRWVWRAVNQPANTSRASVPSPSNTPRSIIACCLAYLSGLFAAATWMQMPFPPLPLVWGILITALLGMALAIGVHRTSCGKQALWFGGIQTGVWVALWLFFSSVHTQQQAISGPEIESVRVSNDQAIVKARGSETAGMIFMLGTGADRWSPGGLYLDTMFDVTLGWGGFERGARWTIKTRRGIHSQYRLDGPPGPMLGKIAFHPGARAPEADGSYVIGEFRPDNGKPLPISVRLDTTSEAAAPVADLAFGPVLERVVPEAIDFDSGKLANFPTNSSKSGDAARSIIDNVTGFFAWAESEGMDGVHETSDSFLGVGMKVEVVENDAWEKLTATDARQRLAATLKKVSQPLKPGEKQPATYAFQTREGCAGILQVIAFADKGVRLRYKLIEGGPAKTAAGAEVQTTTKWLGAGPGLDIVGPAASVSQAQMRAWLEKRLAAEYPRDTYRSREWGEPESVAPHDWVTIRYKYIVSFGDKPNHYYQGHRRYTFTKTGEFVRSDYVDGPEVEVPAPNGTFGPVVERVLPSGVPCREQYFQFRSGEVFVVGNGPGTSKEEAAYDEQRIEEAGGADMSAGSSEEQIHIAGRGCIFTRDFWDKLKWDSFSAEQAVSAIKRARNVDGVVTPTNKELPITYLFKTANGEVGLMEVLGVVEDQRNGWTEKGMKFRYKLVQGTGTTTAAATTKSSLAFGPETQGLQAALEVTSGEPFKLRIHVRNASDRGISIGGALYRQDDECLLTDAQGEPVPVTKLTHDIKIGMKGGYFGPGQVAVFECAGLSFQDIDKAPASAGYVAKAGPGRYTLRFRLRLPGDDVPFVAGERDWKGELETAPVTIEVKDPSTQPSEPVADSIRSSVLGPVVERVVNDLQTTSENCALNFDSGKLLPVPANITLDTLMNPQAQPVAVAWARDNQVDAVAFVTIDAGKIVKCGLLCPGLVVLQATSEGWIWDSSSPQDLKRYFDETMHEWKELPHIAEVTSDGKFPANYMILDTRTRRRGVLQIAGVADNPSGVKIRYRLVEGAAVKKTSQPK